MIAASRYGQPARRGERVLAIALVGLIHIGLAFVIISGFTVRINRSAESPLHLIDLEQVQPPPPLPPPPPPPQPSVPGGASAAQRHVAAPDGTETPAKAKVAAPPAPVPAIALPVTAPAGGGLAGQGGVSGGTGGGQGGSGSGTGTGAGDGGGGTDLIQVAGSIERRDYPRALREAGIGGRVAMLFTVAPNGRVSRCVVTRSSGVPELDELTCRLIRERFVFRPETDRNGRAIASEVDGEHLWSAGSRE